MHGLTALAIKSRVTAVDRASWKRFAFALTLAQWACSDERVTPDVGPSPARDGGMVVADRDADPIGFDDAEVRPDAMIEGTQLTVQNYSFEDNAIVDGQYNDNIVPTGWRRYDPDNIVGLDYNHIGLLNPTGTRLYPAGIPHGKNVLLLFLWRAATDRSPVGVEQTTPHMIAAKTRYTLYTGVGNIQSISQEAYSLAGFPGYRVQLLAGDTVLAVDENTQQPRDGTWGTSTVVYESGDNPPQLGQPLTIRVMNLNTPNSGIEVNFDDVQLYAETMP